MFSSLDKLNFENLRRKRAFKTQVDIEINEEKDSNNELKPFNPETDVLPVTLKESHF
jgi:hypothetical protein